MKFQKWQPFIHHFSTSFPKHLSAIYFIICPNEQERKKILIDLASYFTQDWDCKRTFSVKEALTHLNTKSLFSSNLAAICDEKQQIYQYTYELLKKFVERPPMNTLLLLGLENDKQVTELYKNSKKEIVILDLCQEKPWEKKERIKREITEHVTREQKNISSEALEAFFERLPLDRSLILQEVEKLLCFTLERSKIEKEDVEKICNSSLEISPFQLAQQIIWDKIETLPKVDDPSLLLPLISQLRYHLEMGLTLSALFQRENPKEEAISAFPQISLKILEKYLRIASVKKELFFLQGLDHLFTFELGVKTSFGSSEVLFAQFYANLF